MRSPVFSPLIPALLSLLCLPFPASLLAQKSASPPPAPYAAEPVVIERTEVIYDFNADGTGWRQRALVARVQSEAAVREFGVVAIPFAGASEKVEFHFVRVRHADGSVTETPVTGVMEQPEEVTRQAPFYSDLKQAQLPVKNLRVGDTLEWEVRVLRTRAEAPGHFWGEETLLTEDVVARSETLELRVPLGSSPTVWTNPTFPGKPVESSTDKAHIWHWEVSSLKPTTGTEAEARKKALKSHLLTADEQADVDLGKLPSVAWTTFKSWPDVGSWYRGLQGSRIQPDDEIKAKVAEITANAKTTEDKVRAVYAYVSAQIRYIGVAFGVGRYQPHEAVDVLHNQYGDCKDKQTLLSAMLSALNVPSDAALIGAGVRFNAAVPSPGAFNHLIAHLTLDGQDVWLDPTEEVAPYRMMFAQLRGKEALVIPATGPAHIATTPRLPPFDSADVWVAKGKLDENGTTESHIKVTLRGDDELAFRSVVRQVPAAKYDELMQHVVANFGYSGTSSHAEFSAPEDTAKPLEMAFDYHREKSGDWDNLRIIPQLEPDFLPAVDEKDPPTAAIQLGAPRTVSSHSELQLPAGWTPELPEAVHEKSPWATYDRTYKFENGTLTTERRIVILADKVPATDWKAYKKWTDASDINNEDFIQLRKPGGTAHLPAALHSGDRARLNEIDDQLGKAYKAMDAKTMKSLLKEMKGIDPQARRLYAWSASLAYLEGKNQEAIRDNWKELELYPDEVDRYNVIVFFQMRSHDRTGAEDTLRKWAEAVPTDPDPMLQLSSMLEEDGTKFEALEAAQKAAARAGDDSKLKESVQLQLGKAQLTAGKTSDGVKTYTALLNTSDNPLTLNNAAYDLADAKLELPLAEKSALAALEKLTAETASWTLDENPALLASKTSLLLATWDTVGWILYREGKLKEAESYLVAARLNRPNDFVVQKHLDEVRINMKTAGATPGDRPAANATEQQLRTIPLGTAPARPAAAEYRLLLSKGRVQRSEPTGEKTVDGADAMLRKADFTAFFPAGSDAKLARQGIVNCVPAHCELVLEP
jgi:tetratricopeptide (TPR) repeat protein